MAHPIIPFSMEGAPAPIIRLDALIANAQAELAAAKAQVASAEAELAAIEPHPHAHGHTAGGDCRYAGFRSEHRLPLAALLATPWEEALGNVEAAALAMQADYLLKGFPILLDCQSRQLGEQEFAERGAAVIAARAGPGAVQSSLEPMLAIGMVWHLFGFHHRDRYAWVGAFARPGSLRQRVASTAEVTSETAFGDALTATIKAQSEEFALWGRREMVRRAEARDAERQASWAAIPEQYRESGSWRSKAPTKRQRHLMQRIEAARSLPITIPGRRGDVSDWIKTSGGNPRFARLSEEEA